MSPSRHNPSQDGITYEQLRTEVVRGVKKAFWLLFTTVFVALAIFGKETSYLWAKQYFVTQEEQRQTVKLLTDIQTRLARMEGAMRQQWGIDPKERHESEDASNAKGSSRYFVQDNSVSVDAMQ